MTKQNFNKTGEQKERKATATRHKFNGVIFAIVFLLSISFSTAFNFEGDGVRIVSPLDSNGDIQVQIQDYNGETVSFFLTRELQLTNLTQNLTVSNSIASVHDSTGCLVGDAIDIYDEDKYFQGVIKSVSGNNISFTPKIDNNYLSLNTEIKCGEWNMNVDGSTTPVMYYISTPSNRIWDIESIAMQFIDNVDWDISTFGSRTQLANGFTVSLGNGIKKELFLIYNNGGFTLRGGVVQTFAKAPAGSYGFSVDMNFEEKYGAVLKIDGTNNESLSANINDDLRSQEQIAFVVRGHYKDE